MLVMNKIDVTRLEDLTPENRAMVDDIINSEGVLNIQVSCYSDEGVMELKNKACDALLEHRVDTKLKGNKVNSILNRLHVAQPKARDEVVREPFIPESVKEKKKYDKEDPERRRLERDVEAEEGGPGVYNINLKSTCVQMISMTTADCFHVCLENYLLSNPDWNEDIIPEVADGKNIADFIDPDILEKLEALEREEEKLEAEGFYDEEEDMVSISLFVYPSFLTNVVYQFDSEDEREAVEAKDSLKKKIVSQGTKKAMKNSAKLPRTVGLRTLSELTSEMTKAGLNPSRIQERAEMLAKVHGAKRKRQREEEDAEMDVDGNGEEAEGEWMDVDEDATPNKRTKGNSGKSIAKGRHEPKTNRQFAGFRDEAVSDILLTSGHETDSTYVLLASIESGQAAESRTKRTQHAGEGRRGRSHHQNQNGSSQYVLLSSFGSHS